MMATNFESYRERIARLNANGNEQYVAVAVRTMTAELLVDIAEALAALVGVSSDGLERLGGWERIAGVVELPDGRVVTGTIPAEASAPRDEFVGAGPTDDDEPDALDIEVGSWVLPIDADANTLRREVMAMGLSEGKEWLKYGYLDEDDEPHVSSKLWADQFVAVTPAPLEPADLTSEDAQAERKRLADEHMANLNNEKPVEYEPGTFDLDADDRKEKFDVPIAMPGKSVKIKKAGK
jgi:hypothetical protein